MRRLGLRTDRPLMLLMWACLIGVTVTVVACSSCSDRGGQEGQVAEAPPPVAAPTPEAEPDQQPARDPSWATPLGKPGLPNFHKVSDTLYRGAQPTAEGFRELRRLGVKTIVNLRSFHSDRDEIGETALAYERITMKSWHAEDKEVVRFLEIVTDPARQPVFVHCQHGADRTGTMCAIYRVAVQGWSKEDAIKEMKEGGFGFHSIHVNLPKYVRDLDIEEMKRRAGMIEEDGPSGE